MAASLRLVIDQRQQSIHRVGIAPFDGLQDLGDAGQVGGRRGRRCPSAERKAQLRRLAVLAIVARNAALRQLSGQAMIENERSPMLAYADSQRLRSNALVNWISRIEISLCRTSAFSRTLAGVFGEKCDEASIRRRSRLSDLHSVDTTAAIGLNKRITSAGETTVPTGLPKLTEKKRKTPAGARSVWRRPRLEVRKVGVNLEPFPERTDLYHDELHDWSSSILIGTEVSAASSIVVMAT